jgi:hypothetical protein
MFFTLFGLTITTGCTSSPPLKHSPDDLRDHIISVDGHGIPHDPASPDGKDLDMSQYRGQLAHMFASMRRFHQSHPDRKVLIFVHGGLNAPGTSLAAADAEMDHVIAAGYYPIYLDWDSDLNDSYGEHLVEITQGQEDDSALRKLISPLYFIADLGKAISRAPIVWANQIGSDSAAGRGLNALPPRGIATTGPTSAPSDAGAERWTKTRHGPTLADAFNNLNEAQTREHARRVPGEKREEIRVIIGPDVDTDPGRQAGLQAAYVITIPTKFGLSWIVDGLGTPAWQNMSRRTLMAFDGRIGANPDAQEAQSEKGRAREGRANRAVNFNTTGAIEVFREEFLRVIADRVPTSHATSAPSGDYQVTLMGHSMGTIILNEWLRRDLMEQRKQFYASIVYMAAACSVRDFSRSVIPYMVQHRPDPAASDPSRATGTQFYSLMLHPLAELRERPGYDLPPRGSLLVWLDNFLTDPQTQLDRTLGRWDNIIPATDLIPQNIRGQVTLKAFALAPYDTPPPAKPNYGPQTHGQFRGEPYWCTDFWKSASPTMPPIDCH